MVVLQMSMYSCPEMKAQIKDLARKCQVLDLSPHSLPHCVCVSSVDSSKKGRKCLPGFACCLRNMNQNLVSWILLLFVSEMDLKFIEVVQGMFPYCQFETVYCIEICVIFVM